MRFIITNEFYYVILIASKRNKKYNTNVRGAVE